PNVLAKEQALEAGAFEAWMVDEDGLITEGTASNAWIVNHDGEVITRDAGHAILSGITRLVLRDLVAAEKLRLVERPFSVEQAKSAKEAFLSSTTSELLPVVRIDDTPVGDGKPGALSRKLAELYRARLERGSARP
ncbi:MAG: aminotransferase class IV, partial [Alphaproteobacteria bacterium]